MRAQRPFRAARVDGHGLGAFAGLQPGRDAVRPGRLQPSEVQAPIQDRIVRRDDHAVGSDRAGRAIDVPVPQPPDAAVLEHLAAVTTNFRRKALDIADRMDRELAGELNTGVDRERRMHLVPGDRQTGPQRGLRFLLDRTHLALADTRRCRPGAAPSSSRFRRRARRPSPPRPSSPRHSRRPRIRRAGSDRRVHGGLQSGHLRGVVPAHPRTHPAGLEYGDSQAGLFEQQGGGQPVIPPPITATSNLSSAWTAGNPWSGKASSQSD